MSRTGVCLRGYTSEAYFPLGLLPHAVRVAQARAESSFPLDAIPSM
jgi:hypothetical protein